MNMHIRLGIGVVLAALMIPGSIWAEGLRIFDPPPAAADGLDFVEEAADEVTAVSDAVDEAVEDAAPPLRLKPRSDERTSPARQRQPGTVATRRAEVFDPSGFEIGLRAGSFIASGDWLTSDESALYGGVGYTMRYRFWDWAIELSMDILGRESESGNISETRFNGAMGAVWYFSGTDWVQVYTSFGLAFNSTQLDFEGPESFYGTYEEFGAYTGLGTVFLLGDWRVDTEMRILTLSRDDDEDYPWRGPYSREAPDFRIAAQLFLGISYSLF